MEAAARTLESATDLCARCPKMCRFSCPVAVADGRESSTPTAKMIAVAGLVSGRISMTPGNVEPLYRCTGCLIQREFCKHEVDVPDALEAARAFCYERGVLPAALREKEARLRTDRDPVASELAGLARAAAPPPRVEGDPLLLAGCRMLRDDADGPRRALAALAVAGVRDIGIWDRDPICCGYPLHALGDRVALARQARRFAEAARGHRRLIAADPSCAFTLRTVYPALGVKLRPAVLTLPEALADGIPALRVARPLGIPVVYHDPCHLGRRLGVYEPPRRLLDALGARRVAAAWDGAEARCAGWGGAYPLLDPRGASAIAMTRANEMRATGAACTATACPSCRLALRCAGAPDVVDLSELVLRAAAVEP